MLTARLIWKFATIFVLVFTVFAAVTVTLVLRWQRDHLAQQMTSTLHELATLVAVAARDADSTAAQRELVQRMAEQAGGRVTLLGAEGEVLSDSIESATPDQRRQPEVQAAARHGTGLAMRTNPTSGESTVYYALRLEPPAGSAAYVRVGLPWSENQRWLQQLRNRLLALFIAGGASLLLASGALLAPIATRAQTMTRSAQRMTAGDFDTPVATEGADEIGLLGRAFDEMRVEMAAQLDRLKKNSDRLAIVLGTMSEGVVAIDNRKQILFANNAARAMLEFATPDPVGRPLLEAVRNRNVQEAIEVAFTSNEPRAIELELGSAVRRMVDVHTRWLPGSPSPGVLMVLHDVTDLRRLENLRQEFVANVSHELKTPLTIIKAFAETLLEGAINDTENNVSFVRQIADQAERLHQLILDLLTVARIESGHERFEFAPIALAQLIEACVQRYSATADGKSVLLGGDPSVDGLQVLADEEGLREILDNLVDNAIKYTPSGGRVTIRCHAEPNMVRIDVADTGIGIPADQQVRIFERFYRVDKARSRELGGTGLGLSIVKHLVAAMGGTVAVASEPNQGSTFTVTLPRA